MANILPVSDLRNYNEVLKNCHKGEPVYLTKNGRGRFVVMDIEDYERDRAEKKLLLKLQEAEEAVKDGEGWLNLDELKAHYQRGGLGDMKVKKFLNEIMQETLEPIRNRRKEFEKDIPAIYDMLKKGCDAAREVAAATLDDVRKAMKINYFDDAELIAEQVKKFSGE